ncbi:MAG: site-2 protease family protein [Spirochaetia bacterium]
MLSLQQFLLFLPGLVAGLTIHEFSHAYSAKLLGDSSSARMGRLSLNPFSHLTPLGLIALYFLGFGWAKPVMINVYNFKKPKLYYLLSSLAGPAANMILAGLCILVLNFIPLGYIAIRVLLFATYINVILAVINLLPVPPLDGSKIWPVLFPGLRIAAKGSSTIIWIVILFAALRFGLLNRFLNGVITFVNSLIFI